MGPVITVGMIDNDRMLLDATTRWFESTDDIEISVTAVDVGAFLAGGPTVDVVLLDVDLRDGSRPAANVDLLVAHDFRVLVVSEIDAKPYIVSTLAAGAVDYLPKTEGLAALATAIREVAAGTRYPSPELAFAMMRHHRSAAQALTAREREALELRARGMSIDGVAAAMRVSPKTVGRHLDNAKDKYRATTREDLLLRYAAERDAGAGPPL